MRWIWLPFLIGAVLMLWGLAGMAGAGELILRMEDARIRDVVRQICAHHGCSELPETEQIQKAADAIIQLGSLGRFDGLAHLGATLEVRYDTPRDP